MQNRIRLLHIHASADIGGAEKITLDLFKNIRKETFDVRVLFDCRAGIMQSNYAEAGIETFQSKGIIRNIRFIVHLRPDIIHLYGLKVNIKWRVILWLLGFRNIIGSNFGLTNAEQIGFWRVRLDVLTACFLKKYITNSAKVAGYLKDRGFPKDKLEVIYCGIENDQYRAQPEGRKKEIKQRLGIPFDCTVINCVANLRAVKGHVVLIDALAGLKGLNFSALMIGEGALRDTLIKYAWDKGLKEKIFFLGHIPDIHELLAITDIFALASLSEGMPISIMEAMAAGLPVVATDVGGVSELVMDNETGFLVPCRNPLLLAEKIKTLMDNKTLRVEMGGKGQIRIKEKFSLASMVKKTEELYRELVNL
ncbi:MAG: glycosyltransferase [Nitrospirae bacterium]|nr:glycosyltransferase [Nitrospirota bacterium]